MSVSCPDCGAVLEPGTDCQAIFDSFLVLEFTDAEYGSVHFLTVACFMIQHGRYGDEALDWIEQKLHEYLDQDRPLEWIRRQAGRDARQDARSWKITRQTAARRLPRVQWSLTIADVASKYTDAPSYCGLVRQWARATLAEMALLRPAL